MIDPSNPQYYKNCSIKEFNNVVQGKLFQVQHDGSNEMLYAISLPQAFKMARLLNLDYEIFKANI